MKKTIKTIAAVLTLSLTLSACTVKQKKANPTTTTNPWARTTTTEVTPTTATTPVTTATDPVTTDTTPVITTTTFTYTPSIDEELLNFELNDDNKSYSVLGLSSKGIGSTSIKIPATHNNLPVTSIRSNAFSNNKTLEEVTIEEGLVSIESNAFYFCSNLKSFVIPTLCTSLKTIGENAFYECKNLGDVSFNRGLKEIGEYAFLRCSSMENVLLPSTLETMGNYAFAYCKNLINLVVEDGVTTISTAAFRDCYRLHSLRFPDSVTKISSSAFSSCKEILSVYLGKNLAEIESSAFYGCENLVEIYNGSSLDIKTQASENGQIALNALVVHKSEDEKSIITDKLTESGNFFFAHSGNKSLLLKSMRPCKDIFLPSSFTFDDVEINNYTVNEFSFRYRNDLVTIHLGTGAIELEYRAFSNCENLTTVDFGSVKTIGIYAFADDVELETIELPKSLTELKSFAFTDCSNLKTVKYAGTIEEWGKISVGTNIFDNTQVTKIECTDGNIVL